MAYLVYTANSVWVQFSSRCEI